MVASFVGELLGFRHPDEKENGGKPNFSDGSNRPSVRIASHMLDELGIARTVKLQSEESSGTLFEELVQADIGRALQEARPDAQWDVRRDAAGLSEFAQYSHLGDLKRLVDADTSNTLATALGQDYEVAPDVTVALLDPTGALPFLHATVSCKLTLRSDRAQNAKTESAVLTRHRKGRMPHVVGVTAEPLPSRIASLAQGTGDLDAVYHVALGALENAVAGEGTAHQIDTLELLVAAGRLRDYEDMLVTIAR